MGEGDSAKLKSIRSEIDGLDADIVRLIGRRLDMVRRIGDEKSGKPGVIRDPDRERQVLDRVEGVAREIGVSGPLARRVFSEIISHSLSRQAALVSGDAGATAAALRVAFQGAPLAQGHLAAQKYLAGLDRDGKFVGFASFREAMAALTSGATDLAFLPVENTTAGSINQVYDLLRREEVYIVGEETWRVDHCLAGLEEAPVESIRRVIAHPEAFEQCSLFLRSLRNCEPVISFDAAETLRLVAESADPTQAGIGSPEAAAAHGLVVLRHDVADQEESHTRFVALARAPQSFDPRIPCKTSLILVTRHEEGALLRCLEILGANGLNMTKLESRPWPGRPWEYMFFVDFDGNVAEERTIAALDELRVAALYLKVLGSYPAKASATEAQSGEVKPSADKPVVVATPVPPAAAPAVRRSKHYKLADRDARSEDTVIRVGDLLIGGAGFTVMAGPCSVESAEQIQAAARHVRANGAHILRGGVFKPRTSPYAFQGLGLEGLELLAAAGKAFGMPIVTEVMALEQVRAVSEKADILQIGARNMQNFNLLREVGKVHRPVLLKRGLSSTIEEWLAAAEYILAQGNGQVILCERGIRTFESATRNTLDLSAVVVLRERTHLPVVVDPSHGTGVRAYVAPMAWAARACGTHGLLIEVHPDPDKALSDGDQSLTLPEFTSLMQGLAQIPGPRP